MNISFIQHTPDYSSLELPCIQSAKEKGEPIIVATIHNDMTTRYFTFDIATHLLRAGLTLWHQDYDGNLPLHRIPTFGAVLDEQYRGHHPNTDIIACATTPTVRQFIEGNRILTDNKSLLYKMGARISEMAGNLIIYHFARY